MCIVLHHSMPPFLGEHHYSNEFQNFLGYDLKRNNIQRYEKTEIITAAK